MTVSGEICKIISSLFLICSFFSSYFTTPMVIPHATTKMPNSTASRFILLDRFILHLLSYYENAYTYAKV